MKRTTLSCALLAVVSLALSACDKKTEPVVATPPPKPVEAAPPPAKPVTILASWGGGEEEAFKKVLEAFTAKTGVKVQYEQARDAQLLATLRTRVASKNPPGIAMLPRPGFMADLAREGALKSLTDLGLTPQEVDQAYSQA
jgi:ABC-type glycerol-3-phosphate transport system substrate-binding protein